GPGQRKSAAFRGAFRGWTQTLTRALDRQRLEPAPDARGEAAKVAVEVFGWTDRHQPMDLGRLGGLAGGIGSALVSGHVARGVDGHAVSHAVHGPVRRAMRAAMNGPVHGAVRMGQ